MDQYDIWFAEHGANDIPSRDLRVNEDFKNGDGQSLEQLIRVVVAKNPNIVIIFPEIQLGIVKNSKNGRALVLGHCNNEYQQHHKIHTDLAQHYEFAAIVQMIHVPCSQYDNFSTLPYNQQEEISRIYIKGTREKFDLHPTEFVHKMMAEFILHYFLTATLQYFQSYSSKFFRKCHLSQLFKTFLESGQSSITIKV